MNLHIFQFNDLALVQLRNAGGYSLNKTGNVADSIALYKYKNNNIQIEQKFYTYYGVLALASFKQVFDVTISKPFLNACEATYKVPSDVNVSISNDREKVALLYNNYGAFAGVIDAYNNMLREHLEYLKGFITFLKRNYHIE